MRDITKLSGYPRSNAKTRLQQSNSKMLEVVEVTLTQKQGICSKDLLREIVNDSFPAKMKNESYCENSIKCCRYCI